MTIAIPFRRRLEVSRDDMAAKLKSPVPTTSRRLILLSFYDQVAVFMCFQILFYVFLFYAVQNM